ncbi:MAG: hypothetical protein Q7U75_06720 [Desulfobacterales bacterium]|nr:hypothetical protein [Desulfobacterales bacterium]
MTDFDASHFGQDLWLHPPVFPYLVTRLVTALYHVIVMPDVEEQRLLATTAAQHRVNDLDTCLVLGPDTAFYFGRDGCSLSHATPAGGFLVTGSILPSHDVVGWIAADTSWPGRQAMLAEVIRSRSLPGALMGDITKGGRQASDEDCARLGGVNPQEPGVPKGLIRCAACGQYHGQCLDPSPTFAGRVMTVHCTCDNRNRCAQCGKRLYERKLNANYYKPADGQIWHVPGFSALSHRCAPTNDSPPAGYGDSTPSERR